MKPHIRLNHEAKAGRELLIISPTRDEAEYMGRTIASVVAQSVTPALWIIVNDGSNDETGQIADEAARRYPWIKVIHRPRRETRVVGPGVVDAFYAGLASTKLSDFDYVCKLDTDLILPPRYFETLFAMFEADPALGTASGKSYIETEAGLVQERTSDQFSRGMTKLFRRECFEEIGGFVREVMWDGIDCHRCRMLGWKAVSVEHPELEFIHLRLMGSSCKSVYHGRLRWGRGQYFMGTHPLYLLAITCFRMLERPWIIGGLLILAGYLQAAWQRLPRYEDMEFRRHLRRWQFAEMGHVIALPLHRVAKIPAIIAGRQPEQRPRMPARKPRRLASRSRSRGVSIG